MKFTGIAVGFALCASVSQGARHHGAAFVTSPSSGVRTATTTLGARSYGPNEAMFDENSSTGEHGIGCPCCNLTPDFFLQGMSPREARIEGPLRALLAGGLATSTVISPEVASAAYGKSFTTSVNQYFPLALPTSAMIQRVVTTLSQRGFTRSNTLFGSSVCPDEINSKPSKSLAAQMQATLTDQNGVFTLGGLGGIPFVGISGMGAFMSHAPTNGKVVIMYGPHVGISDDGQVGKVERLGMDKLSGSCGAGLGAYKAIAAEIKAEEEKKAKADADAKANAEKAAKAKAAADAAAAAAAAEKAKLAAAAPPPPPPPPPPTPSYRTFRPPIKTAAPPPAPAPVAVAPPPPSPPPPPPPPPAPKPAPPAAKKQTVMDNQEEYIIRKLRPKLTTPLALSVSAAAMPAFVTNQMYTLVVELLMEELKTFWKNDSAWANINEVVLIGGIVINRGQFSGSIEAREDFYQPLVFDSYEKPAAGGQPTPTNLFAETFGARADSWFD